MHDYYALYTWAMDRQYELHRQASDGRMVRRSRHSKWVLQWPIARRQAPVDHEHRRRHSGLAA